MGIPGRLITWPATQYFLSFCLLVWGGEALREQGPEDDPLLATLGPSTVIQNNAALAWGGHNLQAESSPGSK